MHIAISGNIGAGKTTLATKLAEHFGWEVCYESVEDNPYLEDFYADMKRWSFHLQIYFLNSRFQQVLQAKQNPRTTIQDRSIYEDAYIFARTLRENHQMTERDFQNYWQIFHSLVQLVPPPDLLIYLQADLPKLKKYIQKRGRSYEKDLSDDYLLHLNNQYEKWIHEYEAGPLLVVNVNEKDFLNNSQDWQQLLSSIQAHIPMPLS